MAAGDVAVDIVESQDPTIIDTAITAAITATSVTADVSVTAINNGRAFLIVAIERA